MPPERARTPDWRDADAYAPLLDVDRSGFAWEWLRRDRDYRAGGQDRDAARWGLHAFEDPERDAIAARPVWRRGMFPFVLEVGAADEGAVDDRFDVERLAPFATLVTSPEGTEHWLLSDGRRPIRIDVAEGTLRTGPVLLRYRLAGFAGAQAPLLVLRRLFALWRSGDFSRALHPGEPRAARWILVLRAGDALAAGASQREIAECLLGREAARRRWRVEASSLRSRAQRLVREARRMAAGSYRELLAGG